MPEQLQQPQPWQTQSRACPRNTQRQKGKKTRQKITTTNQLQEHHKPLKMASGICRSKNPGGSQLPPWVTPNHSGFPSCCPPSRGAALGGGWGTHPYITWHQKPWLALSWQQGLWFRSPQEETGCAGAGLRQPGGCAGALEHICQPPGPRRQPRVHLVCVFLRSTLPAGYVRGEECRATLCHEIRLTFLG